MGSGAAADTEVCRDHLGTLLTEETDALRELEELLKREYDVLCTKNAAAIERAALMRLEKMGGLARVEEQRRQLCALHGYTPDWLGLESLMQWCDPEGTLLSMLRECARRAIHCRDMNNRNGALVAARLQQVEGMLAALAPGHATKAVTYGPKGVAPRPTRSHEWGRV